jgi:hypothetical protein
MRELLPIGFEDPQKLVDAGLRQKADAVINLDDKMLEAWRHTVPGSNDGSTSQDFQRAYTDYARQSQHAGQALQAACPT